MSDQDALALVRSVCDTAATATRNTPLSSSVTSIRARLDGPLRVAIAGRVKAGKSTLLNALVGEKLAPTDAGECTRLVTFYREALGYEVTAVLRDGSSHSLAFTRDNGALEVGLGDLAADDVMRVDIGWPSSALRHTTLIDTPGLASINERVSARTLDFLAQDDDAPGEADAVIYLMRHLHRHDADFLESFTDHNLAHASPVNAVAVLSRADEIGVGRLDALESAARIADRYSNDAQVRGICTAVVPVAGLVAETGLTLQEDEVAILRTLSDLPADELEAMMLSVDRFCSAGLSPVSPDLRQRLTARFGLFGLRYSITALRSGRVSTASDLARELIAISGLPALRKLIDGHFTGRAQLLKARSALVALRTVSRSLAETDAASARTLDGEIERVEASSHEFAELRLVHLIASGLVAIAADEIEEAHRLIARGTTPAERAGASSDMAPDEVRALVLSQVARWRSKAESPLLDPTTREACEIVARSYEGLYMLLDTSA